MVFEKEGRVLFLIQDLLSALCVWKQQVIPMLHAIDRGRTMLDSGCCEASLQWVNIYLMNVFPFLAVTNPLNRFRGLPIRSLLPLWVLTKDFPMIANLLNLLSRTTRSL